MPQYHVEMTVTHPDEASETIADIIGDKLKELDPGIEVIEKIEEDEIIEEDEEED